MAFENVDVSSLRSSLNSCRNSINYTAGKEFISSSSNIWRSNAKNNLIRNLNKLYDEKYKELERRIEQYLSACNVIETYKEVQQQIVNLNDDINRLRNEISSLEPSLYETRYETYTYDDWYHDSKGRLKSETKEGTREVIVFNQHIQNQIDDKNSQIRYKQNEIYAKERELQELESRVNVMI